MKTDPIFDEILKITEQDITRFCGNTIRGRGKTYFRRGHVRSPTIQGSILRARVTGSRRAPYHVKVILDIGSMEGSCDCPHWGNCKHMAALLYAWMNNPESFERLDLDLDMGDEGEIGETQRSVYTWRPPEPSERSLRVILRTMRVQDLRGLAKERGIRLAGVQKEGLIQQVEKGLVRSDRLQTAWASLGPTEQRALQALLLNGRRGTEERLREVLRRAGVAQTKAQTAKILQRLEQKGIGFFNPSNYLGFFEIPRKIAKAIPVAFPVPLYEGPVGEVHTYNGFTLVEALSVIYTYIAEHEVVRRARPVKDLYERTSRYFKGWDTTGKDLAAFKSKRDLKLLKDIRVPSPTPELSEEDIEALRQETGLDREPLTLAYALLREQKMISIQGKRLRVEPNAMKAFTKQPYMERLKGLFETWLDATLYVEVLHLDGVEVHRDATQTDFTYHHLSAWNKAARRAAVDLLRYAKENEWYDLAGFLEFVYYMRPRRLVEEPPRVSGQSEAWRLVASGKKLQPGVQREWTAGLGRLVATWITGPLAWFGVVAVHTDSSGKPVAFQVTPVGLSLLGRGTKTASVVEPSHPPLTLREDLTITADLQRLDTPTLNVLDQVGVGYDSTPEQLLYRLSPQKIHQILEEEGHLDRIRAFFEQSTGGPLPPTFAAQLEAWQQAYGQMRLYTDLTVVELSDEVLLQELKMGTSIEQYILYELSPQAILVRPEEVEALCAELQRKGYTPRVIGGTS